MKREIPILSLGLLVGGGAVAQSQGLQPLKTEDGKPYNVIFIMADDLGYGDLGCYGQEKIKTPHIDQLAQQGTSFMQAYAGCTVSAPSRASLMTGLHTGHTHVRGNKEIKPEGQEPLGGPDTFTLGKLFQEAGYKTGIFGKWGLGYPGSDATPNKMGFDEFFGYNCQRQAHLYFPEHLWWNEDPYYYTKNYHDGRQVYSGDEIHNKAIQFIERNSDKPFYAMLTYTLPHAELNLPHREIYQDYVGDFPEEKPYEYNGGYPASERPYTSFAAMITQLDEYVGEVMKVLQEKGIADRTIVIFTSDNGPHREGGANPDYFKSYGPLRGVKRDLYEGGIRVPFIVSCPGLVPTAQKSQAPIAFWDLMPTYASLIGQQLKVETDGENILPVILGQKEGNPERTFYWEFHEGGGKQAYREGDYKIIRTKIASGNPVLELYNVAEDIHEDHDLSGEKPALLKKMAEKMDKMRTPSKLFNFGRPHNK